MDSKQAAEYEVLKLRDDLSKLRDRYDRCVEHGLARGSWVIKPDLHIH